MDFGDGSPDCRRPAQCQKKHRPAFQRGPGSIAPQRAAPWPCHRYWSRPGIPGRHREVGKGAVVLGRQTKDDRMRPRSRGSRVRLNSNSKGPRRDVQEALLRGLRSNGLFDLNLQLAQLERYELRAFSRRARHARHPTNRLKVELGRRLMD
jgi:hypothetical protein